VNESIGWMNLETYLYDVIETTDDVVKAFNNISNRKYILNAETEDADLMKQARIYQWFQKYLHNLGTPQERQRIVKFVAGFAKKSILPIKVCFV